MAEVPILIYHFIEDEGQPVKKNTDSLYVVQVKELEAQMRYLYDNKYQVISLDDYNSLLKKPIIITFDDGDISNYRYAFPLLQKYNFTATFFIIVGKIGSSDAISWQQLREIRDGGMSIQSHTMTHSFLSDLDDERIHWELTESKRILEDKIGRAVDYLALPGGRYNSTVVKIAKEIGYKAICTSIIGNNDFDSNLYLLKRWTIKRTTKFSTFCAIIQKKSLAILGYKTKHFLLNCLKKILGNKIYISLRKKILKYRDTL